MNLIPLTRNQFAIVDETDYAWLSQWKWQARWHDDIKSYYAVRSATSAECGSAYNRLVVRMHRVILNAPAHLLVDHIDGNPLNNRRLNLRLATPSQNAINSRIRSDNRYRAKGIRQLGKNWEARITLNGITHHLGMFHTKEEACQMYQTAATCLHQEFARPR